MNYQRDGLMTINSQEGAPNYYPNSFSGPQECPGVKSPSFYVTGNVDRHEPVNEDDFSQAGALYRDVLDDDMKTRLVNALVGSLVGASNFIVERAVKNFSQVDINLGRRLNDGLRKAGKNINISGKSANL